MLDNPMGQHDELTPIYILREIREPAPSIQERTPNPPYVEAS